MTWLFDCRCILSLCLLIWLTSCSTSKPHENAQEQATEEAHPVLAELEKNLSEVQTVHATFTQEKKLAILDETIVIHGEIFLENPGRMAWHVNKPVQYAMVISEKSIRQWDEDTDDVQVMSLSRNPILKVVVEQLRNWFSGKYTSLTKDYTVSVRKKKPLLVLQFTPKETSMAKKAIKQVTVTFRKDRRYVNSLLIEDLSGDQTTMTFKDTILNQPIDAEAWRVKPDGN